MFTDSGSSQEFTDALAEFAIRIGKHGRAVYHVRFDYMAFGSWVVEAGTRKRRITFFWDGKDGQLRAERTITNAGSGHVAPTATVIAEKSLRHASNAERLEEAERILLED